MPRSKSVYECPKTSCRNQPFLDECCNVRDRYCGGGRIAPRLVFNLALLEPAVANRNPMRDAKQLQIRKHHARALATVVEQHFHPGGLQFVVQTGGERADGLTAVITDGGDRHAERGK